MGKANLTAAPAPEANHQVIRNHPTYGLQVMKADGTVNAKAGDLVYIVPCSEARVANAGYSKAAQNRGIDPGKDKKQIAYGSDTFMVGSTPVKAELRVILPFSA